MTALLADPDATRPQAAGPAINGMLIENHVAKTGEMWHGSQADGARPNGPKEARAEAPPRNCSPDKASAWPRLRASRRTAGRLKPAPAARPPRESARKESRRAKRIFFTNGIEYRDAPHRSEYAQSLGPSDQGRAEQYLFGVVGYTDRCRHAIRQHVRWPQERAEKVRQDLIQRGAPATLLLAVGRAGSPGLEPARDPKPQPPRRVRSGFEGEVPQ